MHRRGSTTSYLLPPTSYLLPPTSYLLPPTSYLLPPTSYLLPPTLYLIFAYHLLRTAHHSPCQESFAYLDPKLPPGDPGSSRSRSHYTQAIVFMCGPGNYLEYLSIREQVAVQQAGAAGAGSARNVLYGCAEMQTPSEFLAQVAQIPLN